MASMSCCHSLLSRFPQKAFIRRFSLKNCETVNITKLQNGTKVATIPHSDNLSAVAFFLDAGGRNTQNYPAGITSIMERMAISGNRRFKNHENIVSESSRLGGMLDCGISRDFTYFGMTFYQGNLLEASTILSECAFHPIFNEKEFEISKKIASSSLQQIKYDRYQNELMNDLMMRSAYGKTGYGLPLLPTEESLSEITIDHLQKFYSQNFTPNRLIIVGLNIPHAEMTNISQKILESVPKSVSLDQESTKIAYTGGFVLVNADGPRAQPGYTDLPDLDYFAIGFQAPKVDDQKGYCLTLLLQSLFGQSKSFSIGGPGKGLHQRMNQNLLRRYHDIESASAHYECASRGSVFFLQGTCSRGKLSEFIHLLTQELSSVNIKTITQEELERSKNQLKSNLSQRFEVKGQRILDAVNQILTSGNYRTLSQDFEMIDSIKLEELVDYCINMTKGAPSISALGAISGISENSLTRTHQLLNR